MPIHGLPNPSPTSTTYNHLSHFDIEKVIRPNILSLLPYRCARDDYQSGILLDANENALGHVLRADVAKNGISDSTATVISGFPSSLQTNSSGVSLFTSLDLHRYPDPAQSEIKSRIAELRRLPSRSNVFLGVGSDEVIDLLMRVCCVPAKERILITPPTYGMYGVCAQVNDVGVVKVPLVSRGNGEQFQIDIESVGYQFIGVYPVECDLFRPNGPSNSTLQSNLFSSAHPVIQQGH